MKFVKIKTRTLQPPQDNIFKVLDNYLPKVNEGDVLFIASKVLAVHQGRAVKIGEVTKDNLIKKEADFKMPKHKAANHEFTLTIKDSVLIPSAGIDESNGNGYFILWPKNTSKLCKEICLLLKKKYKIKKLAVVAVDSQTTPLRWGTRGISIGFYGLNPLYDYRGKKDIFGRKLLFTQRNIVDSLADMACLVMGEGNEQTPLVILRNAPFIKFSGKDFSKKFLIQPKNDLYAPLLKRFLKPTRQQQNGKAKN